MRRTLLVGLASFTFLACGGRTFGDGDLDASGDGDIGLDGAVPPTADGGPVPPPLLDGSKPPPLLDGSTPPPPPPPFDAGPPPPPPPFDAGPPPILNCGNQTCNAITQACCFTQQSATCITKGQQCPGGVALSCTSSASCTGGQVCCANQMGAFCAPSCPPMSPQLCKSKAECKPWQSCYPIPQGQGLGVCY